MNQKGQITNFINGTIIFLAGLVAIVALLPVMLELLPTITSLFGGTVQVMVSAMIMLIVAGLMFNYLQDAMPQQDSMRQ